MSGQNEIKAAVAVLESKIRKLMDLHDEQKRQNQQLMAENRRLQMDLDEEKNKISRLEEGYRNLKEMEKSGNLQSITNMKRKIKDIIVEIDKNMALMDNNHK
jgi:predicted RNase H-like nuclease (RuvC/YqgF family)